MCAHASLISQRLIRKEINEDVGQREQSVWSWWLRFVCCCCLGTNSAPLFTQTHTRVHVNACTHAFIYMHTTCVHVCLCCVKRLQVFDLLSDGERQPPVCRLSSSQMFSKAPPVPRFLFGKWQNRRGTPADVGRNRKSFFFFFSFVSLKLLLLHPTMEFPQTCSLFP